MLATVTLYKNTGFNKDNIPDGPGVLPAGTQMNNHVFLQKKGLGYFDLEGEYSDVQNVDYVKIDNEFYFVTSFEMLNENCARMFLEVDAVTTIGISNMAFTGGWTERQCPSSNTMFSNTVDEPFVPTQDQVVEDGGYIGLQPNPVSDTFSFVGATVDLENVNYEAKSYADTTLATGDTVLVPQLPYPADKTEFSTQIPNARSNELPAMCFYNLEKASIRQNIASVRSLGIENSISYAYQVPAGYCRTVEQNDHTKYAGIVGVDGLSTASNIKFAYGSYIPKEKKAYSGQFHKIQLVATLSNEKSQFYKPEDIRESNEASPVFRQYTDPQPVGTVYFRPKCYKGNTDNQLIESVKGISQRNVPITYSGQSGQFIKDYERRVEATNDAVKRMTGTVNGALSGMEQGAVGGSAGLVAGLIGGAGAGFISAQAQAGKNRYLYEYDRNIVAPEVTFTRSEGLQSYLPNNGYVWGYHLSDIDLQRFDDFLIRYGWADFKKFEITDMFTRPHFNYIKCRDINFNAPQPMWMRNIAKAQLEEGVRIQHEIPNNAAYNSNT